MTVAATKTAGLGAVDVDGSESAVHDGVLYRSPWKEVRGALVRGGEGASSELR
jgi:hypothetical protein